MHAVGERGGVGRGLPQVPVDGELVVGVALRAAAHRFPLGQDPHQQAPLVERLQDRQRGVAGEQEVGQQATRALGPGIREGRGLSGQPVQGGPVDAGVVLRGGHGHPEHERRDQRGLGIGGEVDLAVPQDHAGAELTVRAGQSPGRAGEGRRGAAPALVRDPGHGAGRPGHVGHQRVGARIAQGLGHPVLFLQDEAVAGPAGAPVQLHPDGEQDVARHSQGLGVAHAQLWAGRLGPAQGVDVAQPAPALLQVGLEQEGDLAVLTMPLTHRLGQFGQPALRPLPPESQRLLGQVLGERGVARQVAAGQQGGGRVQVVGGQGQGLLHGAHGVAQLQARVPDRVPDGLRRAPRQAARGVEQEEVEVAARGQLAPAVAPDRHQGQARGVGHRPVEERPQPVVDRGGVGHAEVTADDRRIGEQCLAVEDRGRHLGQRQRPARALRAATWIGSHSGENGGA